MALSVALSAITAGGPRDLMRFAFATRKIVSRKMYRPGFHVTWGLGTRPHTTPENDASAQVLEDRVAPDLRAMYAEAGHRRGKYPRFPIAPPEEGVPDWVPQHGITFNASDLAASPAGHASPRRGRTRLAFELPSDLFVQLNCFVWQPPQSVGGLDPLIRRLLEPESRVRWIRASDIWLGLEVRVAGSAVAIGEVEAEGPGRATSCS